MLDCCPRLCPVPFTVPLKKKKKILNTPKSPNQCDFPLCV